MAEAISLGPDPITVVMGKVRLRPTELVIEDPKKSGTAAERSIAMDFWKMLGAVVLALVIILWVVPGIIGTTYYLGQRSAAGDVRQTRVDANPPFKGLTDFFDEQPRGRPVVGGSVGDLPTLIAQATRGSRCDPRALELSARHLYDVPGQIVAVRLNEGQCNYTAQIVNRN